MASNFHHAMDAVSAAVAAMEAASTAATVSDAVFIVVKTVYVFKFLECRSPVEAHLS